MSLELKSDKQEKLLAQEIDKSTLKDMFENGNISSGKSNQILKSLGYYQGLAEMFRTNIRHGIDSKNSEDIKWRTTYGTNEPTPYEAKGILYFIVDSLRDKMLQILLAASVISLIIGILQEGIQKGWIEGFAIFLAVFIVVSISSFNNWSKEQQFQKLYMESKIKDVTVRRDGTDKPININDILTGEVLKIETGQIVPVDGVLIEGEVVMDESAMNGESEPSKKRIEPDFNHNKTNPYLVSGTTVSLGNGYILVCLVGKDTVTGLSQGTLMSEEGETPLQTKLAALADTIGEMGLYAAILIGVSIVMKEVIMRLFYNLPIDLTLIDTVVNAFVIAVVVIVVAIPEGLPMAVTISLAYSVNQMKKEKNLVRHLQAAETMGGVDSICSDKTGTLTEGNMSIREIFIEGKRVNEADFPKCIGDAMDPVKIANQSRERQVNPKIYKQNADVLFAGIINNCDSVLQDVNGVLKSSGKNMTDNALLQFFLDKKIDFENYKLPFPGQEQKTLPFNSEYKQMATIVYWKNNSYRMFVKGAPERFLDCNNISSWLDADGVKNFSPEVLEEFKRTQETLAEQTMRTILLLYRDITEEEISQIGGKSFSDWEPHIKNLTVIGMLGIADKPRSTVKKSIRDLKELSKITIRMVTGDNIRTAIAISREIGIIDSTEATEAIKIVKLKEEREKRIKAINKELDVLRKERDEFDKTAAKLQGSEALKNSKILDQKILKLEHSIIEERNILKDENGLPIDDPCIALEGPEFNSLSGGFAPKKENKEQKLLISHKDDQDDENEENSKLKQDPGYSLNDVGKFKRATNNLRVIARASPTDKFLLVLGLKELNHVVAVTGDGTNDAPALKISDVGFAMGIRGTDIAQAASDIVLMNDSFDSIVTAVKYGRNVFDCIRKFLQFQLTCNVVAVFMTLLGGIVLRDAPLNAIQMLWVNLIMDSFASLALATESPKDELLNRKPYGRNENMLTKMMLFNVITQSIFQIIILTIIIFYGDKLFDVPSDRDLPHNVWNEINGYHFTIFFNIFVFMQVFNSINARKLKKEEKNVFVGILDNYLYLVIQLIIVVGQIIMVTVGGRALRTHPLTVTQHLWCLFIASLSIPLSYAVKLIPFEEEEYEEGGVAKRGVSITKSLRKEILAKPVHSIRRAKSLMIN